VTLTVTYPKTQVDVSIDGVASEATLQDINSNLIIALEELSKDSIYPPFFQDPNTLSATPLVILTVGAKAVERISVKQNDGNTLLFETTSGKQIICPPSGEVQFYDLAVATGETISLSIVGAISNAGSVEVNFFG